MGDQGYAAIRRHGFADVLREHSRSRPDLPAAVEDGLRLTWRDLERRVNRMANALAARGVGADDRLMWLGRNAVDLFALMLAGSKLGAVVCPVNWRQAPAELAWAIGDFDPKVVFWQDAEMADLRRQSPDAGGTARLWCRVEGDGAESLAAWMAASDDRDPDCDVDPEAPFLALYSAAFSGRPAACLLSHTAMLLHAAVHCQAQAIGEDSRYLACGPMFHVATLAGVFATYFRGGMLAVTPRADARAILQMVDRERATHAFMMPTTAAQLAEANADGRYDLSSLFAGGDPANWRSPMHGPDHAPMIMRRGNYGQTEVGGSALQLWLGGSGSGRPNPFLQIRILDEQGQELPDGETGEIAVRGALVMNGYHNRPELNAERSRNGWHRTNDLGVREPDGSIRFVGPKARLIKSAAENIYPTEVEICLKANPAILDACVIGVPDPKWTQSVKALVVLKQGHRLTADEVIEHCRRHIASYKKPRHVEFVDRIPALPDGGVDRDAADALYGGGGYPAA